MAIRQYFSYCCPGAFGLPIPDELLLTLTGYLALRGELRLLPAMAVVVSGAVLGITLDYWVGRAAGARLIGESGAFFRLRPDKFKNLAGVAPAWRRLEIMPGILSPWGKALGRHRRRDYQVPASRLYPVCLFGGPGLVPGLYFVGVFPGSGRRAS